MLCPPKEYKVVTIGQTVNGYTIIATAFKLDNQDEYVILGESDANYVTARMDPNNDEEWFWGHYHYKSREQSQLLAWDDFVSRVMNR